MSKICLESYKGVIAAMNSCYDENGEVSTARVKKLARFIIERGVNGLYVCGSTGEGVLQSVDERKQILEAVLEETDGAATVIAQIGAMSTKDSVTLARHAASAGADAISAIPPFYYGYSDAAVRKHWLAMIEQVELPFIIYHIPSTTGFHLSGDLLREMVQHPQVIGVKCSSASTFELQQFKAIGGADFLVFNGPDEQFLAGRVMGADAGIGGTYGVMPELFVSLERLYQAGKLREAQQVQFQINEIIAALLALPIHSALKELLRLRGIDCGTVREPLDQVQSSQAAAVRAVFDMMMAAIEHVERKDEQ